MSERASTHVVAEQQPIEPKSANGNTQEAKNPKAGKALPTDRVRHQKQIEIIRAFGIAAFGVAGGPEVKPVRNVDVAALVKLDASTVGLATPFLSSIGIIEKRDGGWVPAQEV